MATFEEQREDDVCAGSGLFCFMCKQRAARLNLVGAGEKDEHVAFCGEIAVQSEHSGDKGLERGGGADALSDVHGKTASGDRHRLRRNVL